MAAIFMTNMKDVLFTGRGDDFDLDLPKIRWVKPTTVRDLIKSKLDECLQKTTVLDVLVLAWGKYRDVRKYLGTNAQPSSVPVVLSLIDHTINYGRHPSFKVLVNNRPIYTIQLDVIAHFTIEGGELKIQYGRIVEIQVGKILCSGELAYHDKTILKREIRELQVPGRIPVGASAEGPYESEPVRDSA